MHPMIVMGLKTPIQEPGKRNTLNAQSQHFVAAICKVICSSLMREIYDSRFHGTISLHR